MCDFQRGGGRDSGASLGARGSQPIASIAVPLDDPDIWGHWGLCDYALLTDEDVATLFCSPSIAVGRVHFNRDAARGIVLARHCATEAFSGCRRTLGGDGAGSLRQAPPCDCSQFTRDFVIYSLLRT